MYNTILTSVKINFKSLRMSLLNYIMLVVIFPLTYLIIAVTSSNGTLSITTQVVGIIMSMVFSLFINMQATLIANANDITIRESYAVYNIKPILVFIGQCLFHFILSLPLIISGMMIIFFTGKCISLIALFSWLILSFIFLSSLSILLGISLKNPQIASPIINVIYMLIISTTPLYNGTETINKLYLLNPLTHIVNLFYYIFETNIFCHASISVIVLLVTSFIMFIIIKLMLKDNTGNEKLNIF